MKADLVFTDPPYNVPIDGHVCGSGRIRHREFAMGVGEMSKRRSQRSSRRRWAARGAPRDGAIAFVCMDWRHMAEMFERGSGGLLRAQERLRLEQDQRRA